MQPLTILNKIERFKSFVYGKTVWEQGSGGNALIIELLARWAKRLSWKETATVFRTSWESVHRAVKWVVDYGLTNRDWDGVEQIGIDEIAVFKGHRYLHSKDKRSFQIIFPVLLESAIA